MSPAQTFEERGAEILGNIGNENARSGSFADYDNDGDPDLFIQGTVQAQRLLRNNTIGSGSATFTDVTVEVGLDNLDQYGRSSAWADYDGDGDVDLFLGREHSGNGDTRGDLFRNLLMEGGTGFMNFGAQTADSTTLRIMKTSLGSISIRTGTWISWSSCSACRMSSTSNSRRGSSVRSASRPVSPIQPPMLTVWPSAL